VRRVCCLFLVAGTQGHDDGWARHGTVTVTLWAPVASEDKAAGSGPAELGVPSEPDMRNMGLPPTVSEFRGQSASASACRVSVCLSGQGVRTLDVALPF